MFYTGSANYNADYEGSDVDTWAVVIEDTYDEKNYKISSICINNELIFFCDIRAYLNGIYYSDWAYLPGLYTKYYIINTLYRDLILSLREKREKFAYNNVCVSLKNVQLHFNFHKNKFYSNIINNEIYSK